MKTFGLLPDQILESLTLDEQGEPIVPEGKQAVPLVKLPSPEHDALTQVPEPVLVWHVDRVERNWQLVPSTAQQQHSLRVAQAKALVEAGYTVQPEGFTLALGDNDRSQFTQMLTLVQEALSLGLITNEMPQTIADKDGGKHTVSTLRLRQILVLYGLHYKGIWDAATTP